MYEGELLGNILDGQKMYAVYRLIENQKLGGNDMRKNTWCPLIKDYCMGAICVCYKDTHALERVSPRCTYLNAIIKGKDQEPGSCRVEKTY